MNTLSFHSIFRTCIVLLFLLNTSQIFGKANAKISEFYPYVNITSITEDNAGHIWISTLGDGLFKYDGENYIHFFTGEEANNINSATVNCLLNDSSGNLWIGTQMGINRYNPESNDFDSFAINDNWNYIVDMFEGKNGEVFATTRRGLFLLDAFTKIFNKVISFENTNTPKVYNDKNHNLWIVNDYSVHQYDNNYQPVASYQSAIPVIQSVFDDQNYIYIISDSKMIRFSIKEKAFTALPASLSGINVKQILYASKTDDETIAFITPQVHYFYNFKDDILITDLDEDYQYNPVAKPLHSKCIFKDSHQYIWLGTNYKGFIKLMPNQKNNNPYFNLSEYINGKYIKDLSVAGKIIYALIDDINLMIYDIDSKELNVWDVQKLTNKSINENRYYTLKVFPEHNKILISIDNTVYEFSIDRNAEPVLSKTYNGNFVSGYMFASIDHKGGIWAGGMNPILQYAPSETEGKDINPFIDFDTNPGTTQVHVSNVVTLKNGHIAVAYTDIGLVIIDPETKQYKKVTLSDKYNQMYIKTICEDSDNKLWIGTSDIGLFSYDPETEEIVYFDEFSGKAVGYIIKRNDDMLFIINSILYKYNNKDQEFTTIWSNQNNAAGQSSQIGLLPDNMGLVEINRKIKIIDFSLNDSVITKNEFGLIVADNNNNVLDIKEWDDIKENKSKVTLKTSQNNLNLYISDIDFDDNKLTSYQYKMKDLTNGWKDLHSSNIPLYNLPYGKNKLLIRAKTFKGASAPVDFSIYIKYPWYLSPLFKTIYILILIAVCWIILRLVKEKNRKKIEVEMALREKQLQENMNKSNMDFFANMSHEFRTPLTIISGAAKLICNDNLMADKHHLPLILQRNADRMLRMIGQLMDFNKTDHQKLSLSVSFINVDKLIEEIADIFFIGAREKGIEILFMKDEEPIDTWIDIDILEKIMYNILSNALKFTNAGGKIIIERKIETKYDIISEFGLPESAVIYKRYITISVADTGTGIPEDKQEMIFERFTQLNPVSKIGGTGIGLYFSKLLTETHHGFIKASNKMDEKESGKIAGAVLTFALPLDEEAYKDEKNPEMLDGNKELTLKPQSETNTAEVAYAENTPKILLIDDDYEIICYLKSVLAKDYQIVSAFDAQSGYDCMEEEQPDIIISDIMMNGMNGLELCDKVKSNISFCHIPLILLTAKSTVNDQIEGLVTGADAYIVKPFDPDYLIAAIKSLLQNRENIRRLFSESTIVKEEQTEKMSEIDKELMEEFYNLMESELSNPEINIIKISQQLNISRTKLYYKIKALTGKTPNDFFKIYKLNRSVDLLKENKYKISVIADMVGFNSPSHFTSSFKKHFGVLPSKYFD